MVCSALCKAESNLSTQMPPDLGHSLEELHPGPWNFLSPLGPAHVLLPGAGTGEGLALPPAPGRCRRAAGSFLVLARARSPRPHARPWHCSSVGERGAPRTRSQQADRRFDFPSSCLKSAAIAVFLSAQLVGTERLLSLVQPPPPSRPASFSSAQAGALAPGFQGVLRAGRARSARLLEADRPLGGHLLPACAGRVP